MTTKKRYVMPAIDALADAGPQVAELIVFAQGVTDRANAVYEEVQALQAELAQLKKARKQSSRAPK